jgi:hypothetical protein
MLSRTPQNYTFKPDLNKMFDTCDTQLPTINEQLNGEATMASPDCIAATP